MNAVKKQNVCFHYENHVRQEPTAYYVVAPTQEAAAGLLRHAISEGGEATFVDRLEDTVAKALAIDLNEFGFIRVKLLNEIDHIYDADV